MANYIFDTNDDLPAPGAEALIQLTETEAGSSIIDMALTSTSGTVFQAASKHRVTIGSNGSIKGNTYGLHLGGIGSSVLNDGVIGQIGAIETEFSTDVGIRFSGAGLGSVTNLQTIKGAVGIEFASQSPAAKLELLNSGVIEATGLAVAGGGGADRIINTGALKTTAGTDGAAVLNLGAGDDLYDGRLGTVVGVIKLGDGSDIAYGGVGNETFSGGAGSNTIDGGAGNDTFILGHGHNTINGAGGEDDNIDYSSATSTSPSGFTINLTSGTAYGNGFSDTLADIENITGSNYADTITGNYLDNDIKGGDGDDTLEGGFGNDTLEGGAGTNTARFNGFTAAIVDLSKTIAQETGYGTDTLTGMRNLEGSSGADRLTGNHQVNLLDGNSGNDTLAGKEGNDTLQGESGNDTLEGGAGDDALNGGAGTDTAVFSGPKSNYTITGAGNGPFQIRDNTGQDGTDQLTDIRFAKFADQTVALVNGNPTSLSPSSASVSESAAIGATVATFFGSDPDGDTLTYSLVSDAGGLFGVSDSKLVVKGALNYEAATQHTVTVKASDGWGGELTKMLTITVRNNAAETMPIVRSGTDGNEQLSGEAGNDQLKGLRGRDTLFGEGGDDKLWGGLGNDTLVGGAGKDVFVFDQKPNTKSNMDWIVDFDVKDDTIHLSKKAFAKLSKKGALSNDAFVVGDRMRDEEDRILYHKKGGALFYDPDGTGPAKAIQFATMAKKLAMSAKDFYVI